MNVVEKKVHYMVSLQNVVKWKYKGRENGNSQVKHKYLKLHLCTVLDCVKLHSITDYTPL